jgi:hypothetical protein
VSLSKSRPVLYIGDGFVGQGTVLDMSETNCCFPGCRPAQLGMRLWLCFWPSRTPDDMWVNHTTVRGSKEGKSELSARPRVGD